MADSAIVNTYPITPGLNLERRFTYHPPIGDQVARYAALRDKAHELARLICELSPPSREQSVALTQVEDAVMWANAAISRNEE